VLTVSNFAEGPFDPWVTLKRWLKRCFALYFVPLPPLDEQLADVGYGNYEWSLPSGWFASTSAHKVGRSP
jgi:hypothetical protein